MVIMALTLMLSETLNDQQADVFVRLGKERALFVDKVTKDDKEDQKWNSAWFLENGQSEAFFPAGASNRRYYLTRWGDSEHYLSCQTSQSGKTRRVWIIELLESKSEPKDHFDGTLWQLLRRRGFAPKDRVPKLARGSLNAKKCFAGYYWNAMDGGDYWFVYEDGIESKSSKKDWGGDVQAQLAGQSLSRAEMLEKVHPYPISSQERRLLSTGK